MEELAEYHGSISKRQAEEILNEAGRDGSYLIRDSMSSAGSYCVCVRCDGWVYTYRVFKQKDGLWTIEVAPGMKERLFRKVSNLIAAFKIPDQGISVPLLSPTSFEKDQKKGKGPVKVLDKFKKFGSLTLVKKLK